MAIACATLPSSNDAAPEHTHHNSSGPDSYPPQAYPPRLLYFITEGNHPRSRQPGEVSAIRERCPYIGAISTRQLAAATDQVDDVLDVRTRLGKMSG